MFNYRRSRLEKFCQRKYSERFRKIHILWRLFFGTGVAWMEACNFIKKETPTQVFPCKFGKILKNTYFVEHL